MQLEGELTLVIIDYLGTGSVSISLIIIITKKDTINQYTKRHKTVNKYITNLSSKILTSDQSKILVLGLKYISSKKNNHESLKKAILAFERSNRLKYYFRNWTHQIPHPFRTKSSWLPPPASTHIERYLDRIKLGINTL